MSNFWQHTRSATALLRRHTLLLAYILGLIVVSLAVTTSHLVTARQLSALRDAEQLSDIGSQQRLLAERISHLSYRYFLSDETSTSGLLKEQLLRAVESMRINHQQLQQHILATGAATDGSENHHWIMLSLEASLRLLLNNAEHLARHGTLAPNLDGYQRQLFDPALTRQLHAQLAHIQQHLQVAEKAAESRLRTLNQTFYAMIMLLLLLKGLLVTSLIFKPLMRRISKYQTLANVDPLTGCFNRRSFLHAMGEEQQLVQERKRECSFLTLDIDHFKRVNDTYGHAVGDLVISTLTRTCSDHLRSSDILGRLGGDEFAILLPGTPPVSAFQVAENLRQHLAATPVQIDGSTSEPLLFTVSIGVTSIQPDDNSPLDALERADKALYQAKALGRDHAVLYSARPRPSHPASMQAASAAC